MGLLLLLSIGLVGAILIGCAVCGWILTHPPRRTYASAVARGRPGDPSELPEPREFENWNHTARGVSSAVWDIPGDDPNGPLVVMSHGWGDSRLGGLIRLGPIAIFASRIVLWDIPGHGDASGISKLGSARDAELLSSLLDALGEERVVLYGWSLGGGLSIRVAAEDDRVRGVVAEAPYARAITPARNVMKIQRLPSAGLPLVFAVLGLWFREGTTWSRFDRRKWAARLDCPLLVLHGAFDEICPLEDGRDIANAASRGTLEVIESGDHNRLWTDPGTREECRDAVHRFLRDLAPRQAQPNAAL